uniref:HECT domain-containing protein n=1 Tax=Macrostomum lignano TaxID=282301 RepID=A0A1I8FH14_9PLAT
TLVAWPKQQQQPPQHSSNNSSNGLQQQLNTPNSEQPCASSQQRFRYSGTLLELISNEPPHACIRFAIGCAPEPAPQQQQQAAAAVHFSATLPTRLAARGFLSNFVAEPRAGSTSQQAVPASCGGAAGCRPSSYEQRPARRSTAGGYIGPLSSKQQLPSLALPARSLPLGDPFVCRCCAGRASQPRLATTTGRPCRRLRIADAVGDGSVSASAAFEFCPLCVETAASPQHQQQLARRLAGGKSRSDRSPFGLQQPLCGCLLPRAGPLMRRKRPNQIGRASSTRARRRVARATDSSRKQRGGLGGSGAKRTLSEPHRLLLRQLSATAAGDTATGWHLAHLEAAEEESSAAAAAATPHRSTTPQCGFLVGKARLPPTNFGGGGGFRARSRCQPDCRLGCCRSDLARRRRSTVDLGAAAAVLPSGDSPHVSRLCCGPAAQFAIELRCTGHPAAVGLYGDNDSPPLVFCGSPVGSPRRTAESTAAASQQQQRQSRLDRLSQLVSDAIRGVNDLILAATAPRWLPARPTPPTSSGCPGVLSQSLCPPLHGLLTDELLVFWRQRRQRPGSPALWQLIEETCKPSGQPASRRLNEVLRVRSVGGLSTERLKFNAFVAACLNAQTVHCELFADLSTSLELLNSHSFGIELAVSASSSVTAAGQNNSRTGRQQPLKARHEHQNSAAAAAAAAASAASETGRPRPGAAAPGAEPAARAYQSAIPPPPRQASLLAARSRQRSSTAAGVKTNLASSGGSGGAFRSTLSGLMRPRARLRLAKQQQPGTGKR